MREVAREIPVISSLETAAVSVRRAAKASLDPLLESVIYECRTLSMTAAPALRLRGLHIWAATRDSLNSGCRNKASSTCVRDGMSMSAKKRSPIQRAREMTPERVKLRKVGCATEDGDASGMPCKGGEEPPAAS